jgi:hypothetical protein
MKASEFRKLIREEVRKALAESDEAYAKFEKLGKEMAEYVFNRHPETSKTQPFTKDASRSAIKVLNKLYTIAKDDPDRAYDMLEDFSAVWKKFAQTYNKTKGLEQQNQDDLEKKLSALAKDKVDLEASSEEVQRDLWKNTMSPALQKVTQSYKSLEDKDIVKKLDELFYIIYKNVQQGKVREANGGAARLIVTFFANGTFALWKNEYTKFGLSNSKALEILDDMKSDIMAGK